MPIAGPLTPIPSPVDTNRSHCLGGNILVWLYSFPFIFAVRHLLGQHALIDNFLGLGFKLRLEFQGLQCD